jgi:anti-sigma28 factor (negative regulator of flagellin synthesis)
MSRRQNEAASVRRPADPGAALKGNLSISDDADATPRLQTDTAKPLRPTRAKCASAQPTHHPTGRNEHRDHGETMRLKEMTDVKTDEKIVEEMKQAISNYAGSVTRCPPGKARAPAEGAALKKMRLSNG